MISATALNASTLNKSPQMPLGLDNSRLRVDSQKFLVPSLPVSSRPINPRADPHPHHHHHNPHLHYQQQQHVGGGSDHSVKRRERSIMNGTAHPVPPPESSRLPHALNGFRRSTSPLGGRGGSPNYPHLQSSPRKDAHSPMYAGEVPGFSGSPGGYSARSSVPIPCSSPSPGTSASPKSSASHTLSPNSNGSNSSYSHLPPGLSPATNGASELSQLAVAAAAAAAASGGRLYPPGFPPPSAAAAHHAAFYAAAAAAAGHSLPYPGLFGSPYPPHQHPAAATSYLDFHSKLLRNSAAAAAVASELRSPSQSPPSRSYHPATSPQHQQMQAQQPPLGSPQSTSVTSLHTKLIESVSTAGDRFHSHHNHLSGSSSSSSHQHGANHNNHFSSGSKGVSKGGPLGISGGIMGLTISPNSSSPHKGHAGPSATSATPEMSSKSKLYMEHPGLPGNSHGSSSQHERSKLLSEMELISGSKSTKEAALTKQRMLTRSPEDFTSGRHHHHHHHHLQQPEHPPPQKVAKSISFASDVHSGGGIHRPQTHPYMNGHASHHHHHPSSQHHYSLHSQQPQHTQGHHHNHHSSLGPANLSTDCKRANGNATASVNSAQHHLFLPPSPKKRSAHWNFAVPQSPVNISNGITKDLLPPPPPPSTDSMLDSPTPHNLSPSKYLSQNQQNQKPSNGGPGPVAGTGVAAGITAGHYQTTNAQQLLVVPSSPLSTSSSSSHGGSGPSTPKSPAVHFKFFGSANNKENNGTANSLTGRNGRILNTRNDSSSSTSSVELGVINGNARSRQNGQCCGPWPVEQMPLITAFRKGSMIKLASGDMKAVEDLKEEDFEKAVQMMADTVRIVYCHVISIQTSSPDNSLCKVTLAMGASQNQQVVVESSPEQPFFVRGRGWSSSSPKLTEKMLQLPCGTLAVGDICITLTRHVRSQSISRSSGGPATQHHSTPPSAGRGSKSKSGTTRPYGTYAKSRNSSTNSILKSSHSQQQKGNNGARGNGRKLVSGPATNLADVNNTAGVNNSIIRQTEKINSPAHPQQLPPPPSAAAVAAVAIEIKEDRQLRNVGKDVDIPLATLSSTTTTTLQSGSNNPTTTSSGSGRFETHTKEASLEAAITTTTASSSSSTASGSKRKSISPSPVGPQPCSGEENDAQDGESSMMPPSPKKRRWSAPDQIEVESQQSNVSTGNGTSSTLRSTPSSSGNMTATATMPESTAEDNNKGKESETKASGNASPKVKGNVEHTAEQSRRNSNSTTIEMKIPNIPVEKA